MKYRYYILFPIFQLCLVITSILIDQSIDKGHGEGNNQIIANLLSNIEFIIKQLFKYDDIVNYNFRLNTAILGISIWFFIGLLLNFIIKKWSRR
ncbi:hypothetical protein YSY43_08130 [Paenibacillus sp. YSY-4.3]